ncbi:hypothetical protein BGX23_004400, partial [Mortierella sp. AD031]
MDPQNRVSPLDIPELLAHVAYFVPSWETAIYGDYSISEFRPKSVLSCLLVSKLWHKTFLPVLWHVCVSGAEVLYEAVARYSHLIQVFCTPEEYFGPFHCRALTRLQIFGSSSDSTEVASLLEVQQGLVRNNPRLKYLGWAGPRDGYCGERMESQDFAHLIDLEFLSLSRWDGSYGRFADVLQTVAGSLKALDIYRISGVEDGDLVDVSLLGVEILQLGDVHSIGPEPAEIVACLPNLVSLTMHMRDME